MKLEASNARTGSEHLKQGHGFCTGYALAFVALCRRAGFAARMSSFNNFGLMQGHNAAEVYYDGTWHFFDPTFGTFFYTRPDYDGQGYIPSLREIMVYTESRQSCFCATQKLWTGSYEAPSKVLLLPEDYLKDKYGYSLRQFYDQLLSHGFPAVPGRESAVSYPINIDLRTDQDVWIGSVDGREQDMFGARVSGQYPRFYGATHLGKTRHATAFHTFTLQTTGPDLFRLTYHFFGGKHDQLGVVELKNVLAGRIMADKTTWSVDIFAQGDEVIFLVANRNDQAYVDAIHVSRITEAIEPHIPGGGSGGGGGIEVDAMPLFEEKQRP